MLDRQLQRTVRAFEQTLGLVENIDSTSRQLKQALEDGKTIIVTTLQKFPVIQDQIGELAGKRFAVIVDEAHSSQSGESTKSLKAVLSVPSLEEAERDGEEEEGEDLEDKIADEMKRRGRLSNVSTFAFTATPKAKTLELFGQRREDGSYEAFSLYSMRQAIEEGFILDVLENYTTYTAYWNLLKKVSDDPRYERSKAFALLRAYVEQHQHTIEKKVAVMVEHFAGHVRHKIGGKAKAMIVTRSRPLAVRYKLAVDKYLKAQGHGFKALVAFSGTVQAEGIDYTEAGMNGFPDTQTAETFKQDENRLLIVANKFQTGFDQPLLHTMYVDKKLGGVNAVQTLSRLNRTCPGKEDTAVIDFANKAEELQKAFEPYLDRTILSEGTDPNLLYDLQTRLEGFHYHTTDDLSAFAKVYFDPKGTQDKLHAALAPVVDRFNDAGEEERTEFRSLLNDFVRLYAFLSQILTFTDADLEKLYVFGRLLLRKLPVKRDQLPVEIQQNIDIESYRLQQTHAGKIKLERGTQELQPITGGVIFEPPAGPGGGAVGDPEGTERALRHGLRRGRQGVHQGAGGEAGRRPGPGRQREGEHRGERPADVRPCGRRQDSGVDRHELQVLQADQRRPRVRGVLPRLAVRAVQHGGRRRGGDDMRAWRRGRRADGRIATTEGDPSESKGGRADGSGKEAEHPLAPRQEGRHARGHHHGHRPRRQGSSGRAGLPQVGLRQRRHERPGRDGRRRRRGPDLLRRRLDQAGGAGGRVEGRA